MNYVIRLFAVLLLVLSACTDYEGVVDEKYEEWNASTEVIPDPDRESSSSSSVFPSGGSAGVEESSSSEVIPSSSQNQQSSSSIESSSSSNVIPSEVEESSSSIASSSSAKSSSSSAVSYGTLTDSRDNQTYKTVTIGTQTWMAENLNYDYNEGTAKSYCYNNSADSCAKYGRLYLWSAAMDSVAVFSDAGEGCGFGKACGASGTVRGVCPEGWHLPNYDEWNTLFTAVGGTNSASTKLKSTSGWFDGGNGEDEFGFSVLPAGYYDSYYGNFYNVGIGADFWSSTEGYSNYAYTMSFDYRNEYVRADGYAKYYGVSVRCLRNSSKDIEMSSSSIAFSSSQNQLSSSSVKVAPAPRILGLKIDGHSAVVDSVKENGKIVYWVHYDDLEFRSDLSALKVSDIKLSDGAEITGVKDGSTCDLGTGVKVSVSNGSESLDYTIHAGYQLPGSDFNTWNSDAVSPDSVWSNANTILTTTSKYSSNGFIGAQIKTGSALGKIASGSLYTAEFNPKGVGTLAMASSTTWPDGNELLDFGKKFGARPAYMDVTFYYDGSGDSCDVYVVLENRTGDKNQNRSNSDINKLVASAWYRSTTDDNTGRDNPDVVFVSEKNSAGLRTIRLKLKYGIPLDGSPIKNSSVFTTNLFSEDSKAINNGVIQGTGDETVTHIRITLASSADGNHYNGKSGATLIVDEIRLIY